MSIGVPPVSGPAGVPAVGPEVASTLDTVGTPAYTAPTSFDRPAADWTLTRTVAGLIVLASNAGARISIFVPVALTRSKNCCESAFVGSPKLTHSRVARLKPLPFSVTTEPPSSLASDVGSAGVVEMDVIAGFGT